MISCFSQTDPVAGLSGWMYNLPGSAGSALPVTTHLESLNLYLLSPMGTISITTMYFAFCSRPATLNLITGNILLCVCVCSVYVCMCVCVYVCVCVCGHTCKNSCMCCVSSLVPRPPPSVCVHNNTRNCKKIFCEIFASGQSTKILSHENFSPYGIICTHLINV